MNYEFHPWEIWNGGECPCPDDLVQTQLLKQTREYAVNKHVYKASWYDWSHNGNAGDIIAFRRVKQPEVVTLFGSCFTTSMWVFGKMDDDDTHKLTFNVDSEGNPYNFNCERIK